MNNDLVLILFAALLSPPDPFGIVAVILEDAPAPIAIILIAILLSAPFAIGTTEVNNMPDGNETIVQSALFTVTFPKLVAAIVWAGS